MGCLVLDIGKTSLRAGLVTPDGAARIVARGTPGGMVHEGRRCLDTQPVWDWMLGAMIDASAHEVTDIVVVTHGATAAIVGDDGSLAVPVLDYEHDATVEAGAYEATRPPFAETGSPSLPLGLNLGRQLACLGPLPKHTTVLPYPQYWASRLCGVAASERSSLGCHTDLWAPAAGDWSSVARQRGWSERFAPLRRADEVLGTVKAEVARTTGLGPDCRVRCGAHDSNAALVPFLGERHLGAGVLSTGTWFIVMAPGAVTTLDPARDTLLGVAVDGRSVPTARFMGGREYALATKGQGAAPSVDALMAAAEGDAMVLPNLTDSGGPLPGASGRIVGGEPASIAVATLYVAMMAAESIRQLGQLPTLVVEGPAATPAFCTALAALLDGTEVSRATEGVGPVLGAARLALEGLPPPAVEPVRSPTGADALRDYSRRWRERAAR